MFLHHILSGIPELNKKWSENNNNKTLIVIVIETKKNGWNKVRIRIWHDKYNKLFLFELVLLSIKHYFIKIY